MTPNNSTPGDELVERCAKAYADATGYYVEFHRGLSSVSADKIRTGIRAALVEALRTHDAAARSSTTEVERLRASAQWLASQMTSAEILAADDEHFGSLSAEERIHMMGERRRARDAAILGAREALQSKDHSHAG